MIGTTPLRIQALQATTDSGLRKYPDLEIAKLAPMNARVDHLIDEALALAPDERSAVLIALLDSLEDEGDATAAQAWTDELRQRREEVRSGAAQVVPWGEARARLNAL